MQQLKTYFLLTFIFCAVFSLAQNQNKKWYFGYGCALDFMTNPPTILNNSAMNVGEGCASIADNAGNLLFYTDGSTIYNAAHTTMANGTGLIGGSSPVQAALIIKQPGNSTIYYVFTVDETFNLGFYYSIVDMSLATGIGSVTVKNTSLLNSSQGFEKLSATRHANGTDFWIMTQPRNSSSYYAYLLTATGLNTTAVVSSIGSAYNASGCIKFSPDGQKLASAWLFQPIELYDFNATTGAVSNSLILNLAIGHNGYGCEFSPDGTKLYGAGVGNLNNLMQIVQWDLSAGSNMAILSSSVSISNPTLSTGSMQLAPDGKIYIANSLVTNNSWHNIHVINNPNVAGAGCNFFAFGQPVSAFNVTQNTISHSSIGLPNQIYIPCLTFTASGSNITTCYGASTGSASILAVSGNSGTPTYTWTNGTSTLNTQNINNVSAGAWTVTVDDTTGCPSQSVVTITQPPAITVNLSSSSTSICVGGGVLLTANASGGTGSSLTYSWSSGANFSVGIVTQTLAGTHIYTANVTDANNCTESKTISINYIANPPLTALPNQTICAGQSATLSTSGAIGYTWQPSGANTNSIVVSPTVPITIYTLSATNNTCGITSTVSVNYYDYPVLSVSPNQTICTNQSATLNASGASVFTWQPNSIVSNSIVVSLTVPITIYTVTATNNICATSETVQVSFYSNPTLTITPTQSICPTFTSNLTVSGANTYTWLPN
ncbi:MAG: hypothetical protein KF900_06990, partial [Bacteroidetes bacterium]|nr:hypothetical protein [Bacteroidota bacterium]